MKPTTRSNTTAILCSLLLLSVLLLGACAETMGLDSSDQAGSQNNLIVRDDVNGVFVEDPVDTADSTNRTVPSEETIMCRSFCDELTEEDDHALREFGMCVWNCRQQLEGDYLNRLIEPVSLQDVQTLPLLSDVDRFADTEPFAD